MINLENEIYADYRTMNYLGQRILRNDCQTIRRFCNSGRFHVNSKCENLGSTLLHYAVRYKKHDVVTLLLDILNASTDIQDNFGQTAFYNACERGHFYIVKIFTNRVNISTFLNKPDASGMTPLLIAYLNNHNSICKWLILKGANYAQVSFNGFRIQLEHLETRFSTQINTQNYLRNQTPTSENNRNIRRRIGFTPYADPENTEVVDSTPRLIVRGTRVFSTPSSPETNKEIIKEVPSFLANECIEMMIELKKTCQICFEPYQKNKVVIMKNCGHSVCVTCHSKLDKCHMCRVSF